jgi:membrane protease YdiL (CAAX protease family)
VALGGFALLYLFILHRIPGLAEVISQADERQAAIPHLREAYSAMAVLVAPFAEEFLFRGLLYRALDREWGGWKAIAGSAVFFAIYHPVLSWVPVGAVGALNAWLFRRTGRLAPAIALHMAYNAVVMGAAFM